MTEIKLKACPFCGGKAKLMAMGYGDEKLYGIFCTADLKQEYQHGHFIDNYRDKEEAITTWNTRINVGDKDKKGGDNP